MDKYAELKALAEALRGDEWQLVDGDGFEADNRLVTSQRRLDDSKVAFAVINYGHPDAGMGEPFQGEQVAAGEFIAAANPAAILELIAENERLAQQVAALQSDENSYQAGFDAGRRSARVHADRWRIEALPSRAGRDNG